MKQLFIAILILNAATSSAQSMNDGKKAIMQEQYQKAERIFHAELHNNPTNAQVWMLLTKAYLLEDRKGKATDSLGMSPAGIANDPYYLIARGAIYLYRDMPQESKDDFDKAIDLTKAKDASVLAAIADMHIDAEKGDAQTAIDYLEKAIKRDKKNAALYVSLGKTYRKIHNGTEAYKAFTTAIEKDQQAAEAYYQLGRLFLSQKNSDMYLDYFSKVIAADPGFALAYKELYDHYIYRDPLKALSYFQQYAALSEPGVGLDYAYTDLLYLNKKYDSAIAFAKSLVTNEGNKVQPRIYKLIAYSYAGNKDSSHALEYMQAYFKNETDSNFVLKDFETMGDLYAAIPGNEDSAMVYFEKASLTTSDNAAKNNYYRQLAALAKKADNPALEAKWLGQYYQHDSTANNVILFNWGIAAFKAGDYPQSDSVFALYTKKYPEQGYGYYWRARSNAAIDTTMELGLAVPHYKELITVIEKDSLTASDKKWLVEAYGYLAGYEANMEKDYTEAIVYFEKLLEVDPANDRARKYIDILEKNIEAKGSN